MTEARESLPINRRTGERIQPMKQPGYYPGYSTLGQKKFWDATTRAVIEQRVAHMPPIRFFTPEELAIVTAVCDRIIPQDDRLPEYRIPIVNRLDERLYTNKLSGYRYQDMPPDQDAYRLFIQAMTETARALHHARFEDLDPMQQDLILKTIHDGKPPAAHEIWAKLPVHRFWELLVQDCIEAYYAHPWAWDEIGYGGPAYPRAYMRLEGGEPEPWEVQERRYEWDAPLNSISDRYEAAGASEEQSHHGQGGTH